MHGYFKVQHVEVSHVDVTVDAWRHCPVVLAQVYDNSASKYTFAPVLTDPSWVTPTFARFSTAQGSQESAVSEFRSRAELDNQIR